MITSTRFNVLRLIPWLLVFVLALVLWLKYFSNQTDLKKEENFHQMLVDKIESMGKLEVVKYTFKDVLEHKRYGTVWKFRSFSSKTLLIIGGEAVACVDLTKLSVADIDSTGGQIRIKLPKPEICYVKIDHSKSKVYNTEMSIFDDAESQLIDEAYREAESYIRNEVAKTDILMLAKNNTVKLLTPLLSTLSNKPVRIEFK